MDLVTISFPLALFALALSYLYYTSKTSNAKNGKLLPPPPEHKCWPIIGDNLNYIFGSYRGGQDKFFEKRTDNYAHKLFKTKLFNEDMLFFCTPEGNKFVFSNENKLVKSWFPKTFEKIFSNPNSSSIIRDEIKIFRKVVVQFLKPETLKNYVGMMDAVTQKHLKTCWEGKSELTVFPLMISYTIALGFKLFCDTEIDPEDKAELDHQFHDVSLGLFPVLPFNFPGTKLNVAVKTAKKITMIVEKMVKQRRKELSENKARAESAHDVLTHLLAESNDILFKNDYDIAKKMYGFVNGAYENPSALISSIMFFLADYPQVYERVRQEQMEIANSKAPGELLNWEDVQKMKYTWNVACEVMRLVPPTQGNFREVLSDFVFEGFHIPKGYKIHLNGFATHKNPKYFRDPEKFDPSRFEGDGPIPFSYIPFGGGPRMCPGKEYGRLNVMVFMHNLIKNYRWEKLIPDEKIIANPLSAPGKGLPIRLYPIN